MDAGPECVCVAEMRIASGGRPVLAAAAFRTRRTRSRGYPTVSLVSMIHAPSPALQASASARRRWPMPVAPSFREP